MENELAVSLREIEQADFIVTVGADPINEAPMLAMAMRQARRNGAEIVVIDSRPITLPMDFAHLVAGVDEINEMVALLIKSAVDREAISTWGEKAAGFFDGLPDKKAVAGNQEEILTDAADALK